jgi:hypothetical protein
VGRVRGSGNAEEIGNNKGTTVQQTAAEQHATQRAFFGTILTSAVGDIRVVSALWRDIGCVNLNAITRISQILHHHVPLTRVGLPSNQSMQHNSAAQQCLLESNATLAQQRRVGERSYLSDYIHRPDAEYNQCCEADRSRVVDTDCVKHQLVRSLIFSLVQLVRGEHNSTGQSATAKAAAREAAVTKAAVTKAAGGQSLRSGRQASPPCRACG